MLNAFQFRFFSKKQNCLWQGLLVLVLNFTLCVFGFDLKTYAAKAIVLSDAELDSVHAEGFSFDIDVAFGNVSDYLTNSQNVSTIKPVDAQNTLNPVLAKKNNLVGNNQPQSLSTNIVPTIQGVKPTSAFNISTTPETTASPINNVASEMPVISTVVVPKVSQLVQGELNKGTVNSNNSVSSQPQIVSIPKVDMPVQGVTPTSVGNISSATSVVNPVNNTDSAKTSVPGFQAVSPNMPNLEDNKVLSPLQLDIVAGSNADGKLQIDVDSPTAFNPGESIVSAVSDKVEIPNMPTQQFNPGVYSVSPNGTTGNNVVVVDALAQQNLSALVNVNAAGSVVPVLLNITININSTVGDISNTNNLDLQNYYRFQIR